MARTKNTARPVAPRPQGVPAVVLPEEVRRRIIAYKRPRNVEPEAQGRRYRWGQRRPRNRQRRRTINVRIYDSPTCGNKIYRYCEKPGLKRYVDNASNRRLGRVGKRISRKVITQVGEI